MSIKDLLVKSGLVVLEPSDTQAPSAPAHVSGQNDAQMTSVAPAAASVDDGERASDSVVPAPTVTGDLAENTPLESIYSVFGVATAVFPAEQLLKVLDGMKGMDAASQRTAVNAMAAASNGWTIADVLGDAASKAVALQSHITKLNEAVGAVRNQEQVEKAQLTEQYNALQSTISEQIEQLQQAATLAQQQQTEKIAAVEARTSAASSAGARENARLQTEIEKLTSLSRQFDSNQQ